MKNSKYILVYDVTTWYRIKRLYKEFDTLEDVYKFCFDNKKFDYVNFVEVYKTMNIGSEFDNE